MCKYILVYELAGYPEEGGGTYAEEFGMEDQEMHSRVNELANENSGFSVVFAGFLQTEYEYEPVNIVTEYRPKRV